MDTQHDPDNLGLHMNWGIEIGAAGGGGGGGRRGGSWDGKGNLC